MSLDWGCSNLTVGVQVSSEVFFDAWALLLTDGDTLGETTATGTPFLASLLKVDILDQHSFK